MEWGAVALEGFLLALAIGVLVADLLLPREGSRRGLFLFAVAGLVVAGFLAWRLPAGAAFTDAWIQDAFAVYVKRIVLAAGFLTALATCPYVAQRGFAHRSGEFLVLLLFSMIGAMALVSAREFLTLFVAFELLSLPLYALTALDKERRESPEGALKIFLFGSVSSAALVLGLGMLFAATGTTFWMEVTSVFHPGLFRLGLALLLVGFGFKVAMFPFYMWAPDTYEAAPTPVVAFLSIAPKAAGIAALFRLWFEVFEPRVPGMASWMVWVAALTMIVGNLLALPQTNLKRLLAYSGVAHIGYVLAALAAGSEFGAGMALFYFVAYLFSNVGAFLCVAAVETAGGQPTLDGVRNLVRRSPVVAAAFLVFLLSLGGIPFVLGFWGKMYVFLAAGKAGLWGLVFLGAVLAVVALFYYLNVVRSMFLVADEGERLSASAVLVVAILLGAAAVTLGGVVPRWFVEPALAAVSAF
jgi:NADH-quinone oxidoreductase subunit N